MRKRKPTKSGPTRCAIYTRKSTTEHLDSEITTLVVQRQKAEAFIASQDNWVALPDHYDDGGFTGANTDRPALQRLLADMEAGKLDTVIVYKIDRLSRSILDFLHLLERLEECGVGFVSTTESFNTKHSTGRLMMHILLSFAQYERELISERTSAAMGATRRAGKHTGGLPVLGYDLVDKRLVVNEEEAERVRSIYTIYLEERTIRRAVAELNRRGWKTKRHVGATRVWGGRPWNTTTLHKVLRNQTYVGQVTYEGKTYTGEHEAIVDTPTWGEVQTLLKENSNGASKVRNKYDALLRDVLFCGQCGEPMVHTYTMKGTRRFRYYTCRSVRANGPTACPVGAVPAKEMEKYVTELVRERAQEPDVVEATARHAEEEARKRVKALRVERTGLRREGGRITSTIDRLLEQDEPRRLADAREEAKAAERRLTEVDAEIETLQAGVDPQDVGAAIAEWRPLWSNLSHEERARLVASMIERAEYDGERLKVMWREAEAAAGEIAS